VAKDRAQGGFPMLLPPPAPHPFVLLLESIGGVHNNFDRRGGLQESCNLFVWLVADG
jgi:hypothetical protein